MKTMKKLLFLSMILTSWLAQVYPQEQANYDEGRIPPFKLPELLVSLKGKTITNSREWTEIRRPEIVKLFEDNMYGKIPGELKIHSFKVVEANDNALGGIARRKQVVLTFQNAGKELTVNLLIYLPQHVAKAPLFAGYNFDGNQSVTDDPDVPVSTSWMREDTAHGVFHNRATERTRGTDRRSWQVEKIIQAGYGLATMYYGDVDPDKNDFTDGVHPLLYRKGQTKPAADEWGSITAWAWGLSRAMDYFEKDPDIDASKIIVMGHSRLGKTALWAGALDQRFAIVISNNSGCGGAALSRRIYGETLGGMNQYFPHWLCDNCSRYDGKENTLPVDQHMLIALMAPRPVYIASAGDDKWADPKGEFLSGYNATPVYALFGKTGITTMEMPPVNQPVMNSIGYHIRNGGHGVYAYDWDQYLRFADIHLKHIDPASAIFKGIGFYTYNVWTSDDPEKRFTYGLNINSPWENGGALFMHFPEHLEYNPVGNTILRHYDSIPVPWIISPDGQQASYRVESPALRGVTVESFIRKMAADELPAGVSGIKMAMHIANGGTETLPVIRVLLCMQYSGLKGFPGKLQQNYKYNFIVIDGRLTALSDLATADPNTTFKGCVVKGCPQRDTRSEIKGGLIDKDMDLALSVVTSTDGKRKVIIWWTPGKSMIANANIPCIHADPYFGTLKPGEQASAEGMILFTEGDIAPILAYLKMKESRAF
jgi:hypothetical protein